MLREGGEVVNEASLG